MLADGIYNWTALTAGAGQPMQASVQSGQITEWAFVLADGSTAPAFDVVAFQSELKAALIREIRERQRLGALVQQMQFAPAVKAVAA